MPLNEKYDFSNPRYNIGPTIDIETLSPKAKVLAEQLGHTGNITEALTKDASLIEGLSEYQKWRDQKHRYEGANIGSDTSQQPVKHGVAEALKKLSPPKKRKHKKK